MIYQSRFLFIYPHIIHTKIRNVFFLICACMWDTASVCPGPGHVTNSACDFTETGIEKNDFHTGHDSTVWNGSFTQEKDLDQWQKTPNKARRETSDLLSWPITASVHRTAVSCSDWLLERSCLVRKWCNSSWTRRKEKKCQWNVLLAYAEMLSLDCEHNHMVYVKMKQHECSQKRFVQNYY